MSEDIIEPKEIELDELDAEQIEDGIVTENSEDAVEDLQFSENSESQYVEPASEGDEARRQAGYNVRIGVWSGPQWLVPVLGMDLEARIDCVID